MQFKNFYALNSRLSTLLVPVSIDLNGLHHFAFGFTSVLYVETDHLVIAVFQLTFQHGW